MTFYEYCEKRQPDFCPLTGVYYAFELLLNGHIRVSKLGSGSLKVNENRINEVEAELKNFIPGKSFTRKGRKTKSIGPLLDKKPRQ